MAYQTSKVNTLKIKNTHENASKNTWSQILAKIEKRARLNQYNK